MGLSIAATSANACGDGAKKCEGKKECCKKGGGKACADKKGEANKGDAKAPAKDAKKAN